ncbi:MAG: NAD(P)-dependent oxidoreductase [candidate division WOR-3 bacterium]|nr:MAG: NAD(P)-dependent oxidoreductase [candidate division WOR-3 bacterium]
MKTRRIHVLVTGGAGYVGSVLVRQLLEKGYRVRCLDKLLFGGESLLGLITNVNFSFINGDIRDTRTLMSALDDVDAVLHLAAIVGDPACARQPDLARETNWDASKALFDLCLENGNVGRFIFASTCSNYGKMDGSRYVDENSPLHPLSLYAELKVTFEKYLLESKTRNDFIATALRFGTVHGLSPRMRFDLTVNEFVRELTFGKKLVVYGPQFWRPYIHIEDAARAYIHVLESEAAKVKQNVYNVGDSKENYQKKMLVDEMTRIIPGALVEYLPKDNDPRDFKVDFTKIKNELGWQILKTVRVGIREMHEALKSGIVSDPYSPKYREV